MESFGITTARVLEEYPGGVVHDRLGIASEAASDVEADSEVGIAATKDEIERGRGRGASSNRLRRRRQLVERCGISAGQVPADDSGSGAVDHVPRCDAIVSSEVDLVEFGALILGEATPSFEVENAEGGHPGFVCRMVQKRLDVG
jgi:hypothetical protein